MHNSHTSFTNRVSMHGSVLMYIIAELIFCMSVMVYQKSRNMKKHYDQEEMPYVMEKKLPVLRLYY